MREKVKVLCYFMMIGGLAVIITTALKMMCRVMCGVIDICELYTMTVTTCIAIIVLLYIKHRR